MRIEEFSIRRYGPLPDSGRTSLGDFSLFFGSNEDGKTLTIDALVKLLFGKRIQIFEKIKRVEEDPDGYVIVKDDKGKLIKLPEKGDLTSLLGINPSEARNIFIIRDSDLSISRESEHYREITDKLTGMRTEKIEKIKNCLLHLGRLTPGGDFRDIKEEKIKTKIREASEITNDIEELKKEVKVERFDELEKTLSEVTDKIKQSDHGLRQFELAKNRENYEKGSLALKTLETVLEDLIELSIFIQEDEQTWIRREQDIMREKERRKRLTEELDRKEQVLDKLNENLRKEKQEFEIIERKKKKIDDDLKPDLRNYEIKSGELEQKRGKNKFFSRASLISAILLSLSIIGFMVSSVEIIFYPLIIFFLVLGAGFGIQRYMLFRDEAWMKGMFERIRFNMAKVNLQGEEVKKILSYIREFEDKYIAKKNKIDGLTGDFNVMKREMKNLKDEDIPNTESRIRSAEEVIKEIREKSKVNSLKDYRKKLKELQTKENLRDRQIEVLSTLFGKKEKELKRNISNWRDEIYGLRSYQDKAIEIEYNKEEENRLKDLKRALLNMKELIENKIADFCEKLAEIERRTNNIFKLESDFLHCKTTVDLEAIKERLKKFIDNNESIRERALLSIEFFNEIEKEEEEKVTSLFGKNSPVSKCFYRITDGIYTEVNFSPDERKIYVTNRNGEILDTEKLSGGAYDQLYLSVRLGLGENFLMGKKGFFIMDDPFIKADKRRLKEQIDILKNICESGWQVIYFTAKDEVKEVLKEDIENKKIDYIKIQGIFG